MWKLLPVCLLASCAVQDQSQPSGGENQSDGGRVVQQAELPLQSSTPANPSQPSKKTFQKTGTQGWLDETGSWHFKIEVGHRRLRCATYETGIQLGRGDPACSHVEWLTGVEYATRLRHCNSATRLHAGDGVFPDVADRFEEVSCVRIVVRCMGSC